MNKYEPELLWSDGDWETDSTYWQSKEFQAWLFSNSSVRDTVVVNDRFGSDAECAHGSYLTCDDRYLPNKLQQRKWENAFTLDQDSWGLRRTMQSADMLSVAEVVSTVVQTVALGGNALINVGPSHDGTIDAAFQDRLLGLGAWLQVNGEAIYATTPWRTAQNDTSPADVWYTTSPASGAVYAISLAWPADGRLVLSQPTPSAAAAAALVGYASGGVALAPLNGVGQKGVVVTLPPLTIGALPCMYAWAIRLTGVS